MGLTEIIYLSYLEMPTPNDKDLYEKVKKEITSKYKPSAYRSGLIVKKYKEEYLKKHKNDNAYSGNKENSNLRRWFKETWKNQNGEVGYKNKGDIYRPTKKIDRKSTRLNSSHSSVSRMPSSA